MKQVVTIASGGKDAIDRDGFITVMRLLAYVQGNGPSSLAEAKAEVKRVRSDWAVRELWPVRPAATV